MLKRSSIIKNRMSLGRSTLAEDILMVMPAVIFFFVFHYLPMFGTILSFKRYNYTMGIFGSPWCGLENFEFFFTSQDAWRITRNTVGYAILFNFLGTVADIIFALMLYEISSRKAIKTYQTIMILPHFMSWVIVGYVSYIFLSEDKGVLNNILVTLGAEPAKWYSEPKYWPFILSLFHLWKNVGMGIIMYYAALMGIDSSLYEAATIDGAGKFKQIWSISLPGIVPIIVIRSIMAIGNVFRGDFGLYYQLSRDIGALYPTTDVIDTYIYRGLTTGDVGITAAVGFFQSFVGLVMVSVTNHIVNRIDSDLAMF